MKQTLAILIILSSSIQISYGQFGKILDKAQDAVFTGKSVSALSQGEVGEGLKQALEMGVTEAVENLSQDGGYLNSAYKINVPSEARTVVGKVKNFPGFENIERDLIQKMNEAAEIAAKKATPIFVDAIKEITFDDAKNILAGEDNAATSYLSSKSRSTLYKEFMPIIQAALDEVKARELWSGATNVYNKIPFTKNVNPELDDHVNDSALDGLFGLIAKKELGIRNNSGMRSTELLKKVFGN